MSAAVTRRTFLGSAGACLALGSLGAIDPASAAESPSDIEIGRHIYKSLKWNMVRLAGPTLDKFRMLKQIGYDGIELDSPDGIDAAEALAASREGGLRIEGIVNSTHWQVRHSDPDPDVRARALENMRTAMRYAKAVGGESVLLVPGKVTDPDKENHEQDCRGQIAEGRLQRAEGLSFCLLSSLFYALPSSSPWVGIHFDIGNHIRVSPPARWIRVLGKRIKKLDVKDRSRQNEQTLIGDGAADWPEVRSALKELGYRGWAAAEVQGGDAHRLADVLRRMNNVLGESDHMPPA